MTTCSRCGIGLAGDDPGPVCRFCVKARTDLSGKAGAFDKFPAKMMTEGEALLERVGKQFTDRRGISTLKMTKQCRQTLADEIDKLVAGGDR